MFVGDRIIQSCKSLNEELELIDRHDDVRLIVLRDPELIEVALSAGRR